MELHRINHFFKQRIYVVPSYQRGYSWKKTQITDLLNDIKNAIKLESEHYTGTITLHFQKKEEQIGLSKYDIYDIVDGQQRFTTLTLILSYLIDKLKGIEDYKEDAQEKEENYILKKGAYLFRYEIDKVSERYFRSLILEKENLSSLDENLYTRNLKNAKKVIREYFNQEENRGKELEFLFGIEDKLRFNEYIVKSTSEIGVVFETMNNRGVNLSDLEIVKNRLLYLASKIKIKGEGHLSKNTIKNINTKWSIILKNLTLPDQILNEDGFLSNHWIIYSGWSKNNKAKEELLTKIFTIEEMVKNPESTIKKINEYVDSLAVTSLHWRFINYPKEDKSFIEVDDLFLRERIKNGFEKLNRLSNSTVRPLLLSFLSLMKTNPKFILELVELAEVFSFRLFSMNKKRSDTGKNDIYRNCKLIHDKHNSPEFQKYAKFLLSWYIDVHGDTERFYLEIKDLFDSSKKEGYYSWSGLVYFLYEYEEYLRKNQDSKISYSFASKKTKSIEHIIPQSYTKHWKDEMKGVRRKDAKGVVHSLGNLVLINKDKNSSLRNSAFEVKKSAYVVGSYSENEITKNDIWNVQKVEQREHEMIDFLTDRWFLEKEFLKDNPYPEGIFENSQIKDEFFEDE